MKTKVQFVYTPGFGGSLYKVSNGEQLDASFLTLDCHGNYRVVQHLGFHASPLTNGQILDIMIYPAILKARESQNHK